ncbi:MAG: hypothetical protein J6X00_02070 [Clostridia bacterium]|nr:hypothetical protein [Clostridia bacterium]
MEKNLTKINNNELTPEEEIEIAELENHIIQEHEDELDAIAMLEETSIEHNNTFENLKAHATKTTKAERKNKNGSWEEIAHDEKYSNNY